VAVALAAHGAASVLTTTCVDSDAVSVAEFV